MIKLIMHGCNGKMGQVISRLLENDEEACLVAGIDARDDGHNPYPVFTDIKECNVEADALIDFSAAPAGRATFLLRGKEASLCALYHRTFRRTA